jgi:RNA polymerase sigma-B factor
VARKSQDFQLSPEQRKMAAANLNLARREAWRIQRTTNIDYSTLEGVAFLGLCKACHRYDPDSGFKFSSLAIPTIRGELLHWVRDRTYPMRLSHKMRENWVKGRKMLYRGANDIEIAEELNISLQDWQETRSTCSGPPLELKDQAVPTEALEPDEIDFATEYRELAAEVISKLDPEQRMLLMKWVEGPGSKPPQKQVMKIIKEILR